MKKVQLTEQEERKERMEIEKSPLIQTIIRLVEDEQMTAYSIDKYKKSEVPICLSTIVKIIKRCEKYGYIDKEKKEEGKKLRKAQRKGRKGKKQIRCSYVPNGEKTPVMYEEGESLQPQEKDEMLKENFQDTDIIEVINQYISEKEYEKELKLIRARHQLDNITISKDMEEKLKNLEISLVRACKTETAIKMLSAGNDNITAISELTELSKEAVAILKMKLNKSHKKIKFVSLNTREMAINEFLRYKSAYEIQQQFGIGDVEIIDIEEQARYRKLYKAKKQDFQVKQKQDSITRIIVLATKLGIKENAIAKVLKLDTETVKDYLNNAVEADLIKKSELKGISILDYGFSSNEEKTRE